MPSPPAKTAPSSLRLHVTPHVTLVYVAHTCHYPYTYVYNELLRTHPSIAEACIRQVHALLERDPNLHIDSPMQDVLNAAVGYFAERYNGDLVYRSAARTHPIHYKENGSPYTLKTVKTHLRLVFQVAREVKLRKGNPFAKVVVPDRTFRAYRRQRADQAPYVYFKMQGNQYVPIRILHNTTLPDDVRLAGEAAGWSLTEHLMARICIDTGARIDEVTSLSYASLTPDGIRARNKGQKDALVKGLRLAEQTEADLRHYLEAEDGRAASDPLNGHYRTWLKGRAPSVSLYIEFLKDEVKVSDLSSVPIFLTQCGKPYRAKTFRDRAWRKAMAAGNLILRLHQLRHWRINQDLTRIALEAGGDPVKHVDALITYTQKMGWAYSASVEPYDHVGHAAHLLQEYEKALKAEAKAKAREARVVEHPEPDQTHKRERAIKAGLTFPRRREP